MAVIRDVMPAFDLLQPSSAADAQKLLQQHGDEAWVMAGGLDSFDWLKDRIKKPKVLVDLSGVSELSGVRESGNGIEIGAMTTLTEIAHHPLIRSQYGLLAEAVEVVASRGESAEFLIGVTLTFFPSMRISLSGLHSRVIFSPLISCVWPFMTRRIFGCSSRD